MTNFHVVFCSSWSGLYGGSSVVGDDDSQGSPVVLTGNRLVNGLKILPGHETLCSDCNRFWHLDGRRCSAPGCGCPSSVGSCIGSNIICKDLRGSCVIIKRCATEQRIDPALKFIQGSGPQRVVGGRQCSQHCLESCHGILINQTCEEGGTVGIRSHCKGIPCRSVHEGCWICIECVVNQVGSGRIAKRLGSCLSKGNRKHVCTRRNCRVFCSHLRIHHLVKKSLSHVIH